jgi:hypothetical protein
MPIKMIKREQAKTTKLIKWINAFWIENGPWEVKVSKTGRIYRTQFAEHQEVSLRRCKTGTVAWKNPDSGFTNLWDITVYHKSPSWVCLMFNVETSKKFYIIDATEFFNIFTEKKVSITEEEADRMAHTTGLLK